MLPSIVITELVAQNYVNKMTIIELMEQIQTKLMRKFVVLTSDSNKENLLNNQKRKLDNTMSMLKNIIEELTNLNEHGAICEKQPFLYYILCKSVNKFMILLPADYYMYRYMTMLYEHPRSTKLYKSLDNYVVKSLSYKKCKKASQSNTLTNT